MSKHGTNPILDPPLNGVQPFARPAPVLNVSGAGICIPRCNTAGFTCWQGTRCDAPSGYCVAGP